MRQTLPEADLLSHPIAILSMYDWPEVRPTLDRFWALISDELGQSGIAAPAELARERDPFDAWCDPQLTIGQTCGWPFANLLRDKVVPFARFDHALEGCPPGFYNSVYVGQSLEDGRFVENAEALFACPAIAINGADSQSGFRVFREITGDALLPEPDGGNWIVTGAHRNSVKSVASGEARIAAIDAVAWELARRHEPDAAARVVELGRSQPRPGLPLITSPENRELTDTLRSCVARAFEKLDGSDREALCVEGVIAAHREDYEVFLERSH